MERTRFTCGDLAGLAYRPTALAGAMRSAFGPRPRAGAIANDDDFPEGFLMALRGRKFVEYRADDLVRGYLLTQRGVDYLARHVDRSAGPVLEAA